MKSPLLSASQREPRIGTKSGSGNRPNNWNRFSAERAIIFIRMQNPRYALVAYVKSPVGEFVENLRRQLHPALPQMSAHVTLLPPRLLNGTETSALQTLERVCGQAEPFDVDLGEVETFVPTTPTVYIRLTGGAARMRELHDQLNTQALAFREEWPYVPHMTIAKMAAEPDARQALRIAAELWSQYAGSHRIRLESLTFVREREPNCWVDLAPVTLGANLVRH
jgi:2'-5' RNA ligase